MNAERERERSSFAVEWRRFRGHVHKMSTQGGEEGVTQKADKSTNKLRVSVKVTGGSKMFALRHMCVPPQPSPYCEMGQRL